MSKTNAWNCQNILAKSNNALIWIPTSTAGGTHHDIRMFPSKRHQTSIQRGFTHPLHVTSWWQLLWCGRLVGDSVMFLRLSCYRGRSRCVKYQLTALFALMSSDVIVDWLISGRRSGADHQSWKDYHKIRSNGHKCWLVLVSVVAVERGCGWCYLVVNHKRSLEDKTKLFFPFSHESSRLTHTSWQIMF